MSQSPRDSNQPTTPEALVVEVVQDAAGGDDTTVIEVVEEATVVEVVQAAPAAPIPVPSAPVMAATVVEPATQTDPGTPPQSQADAEEQEGEDVDPDDAARFLLFNAMPAWAVSTIVHVLVFLVLALISFADPQKVINVMTMSSNGEQEDDSLEEFEINELDDTILEETTEMEEPTVDMSEMAELTEPIEIETPMEITTVPLEITDLSAQMAPAATLLSTASSANTSSFDSRSKGTKQAMLRKYGGTASSEAAVTRTLKWLSKHQHPQYGYWTFAHNAICNNQCGDPGDASRAKALN
ncbi:MAG: hypothetical protein AAFP90_23335, partial [Planctomycetota bacterium]